MKKKIGLVSIFVILLSLIVTGSFAYFSSRDNANNIFEFGKVKVIQLEQEHDDNGELTDFTQGQLLYPVINSDDPRNDENYIEKLVSVKNMGMDAYVRTYIAVPVSLKDVLHLDIDTSGKWIQDSHVYETVMIKGIEHYVTSYTYGEVLDKNSETNYLLNGVYLDSSVDYQFNEDKNMKQFCTLDAQGHYRFYDYDVNQGMNVYVVTQACQVEGLSHNPVDAADEALGTNVPDFN